MSGPASAEGDLRAHRLLLVLAALLALAGYAQTVNAIAAPFLAKSFGLDDAGIARAMGWISLNAFAVLVLARETDRLGRRRLLLACALGLAVASVASALSPSLVPYVMTQIAVQAFANTVIMVATVVIAEELSLARRATGQGWAGIAGNAGGGLALLAVPALAATAGGWRAAWIVTALPLAFLPWLRRALPETTRWRAANARGETEGARAREALAPPYRGRALGFLGFVLLGNVAGVATASWPYYHLVHGLGVAPARATLVLMLGGGLGLAGFRWGGHWSDRLGRRATLLAGAVGSNALMVVFYLLPLASVSTYVGLFAIASLAGNASLTAARASATELFPTRLRSTVNGWATVAAAAAAVVANFATAALAERLGGLAPAIALLALTIVPALALFWRFVPETAGLELEAAALEEEPLVDAYVALGSNLGDRAARLAGALSALRATPGVDVVAVSRWYETTPVGPPPQGPYLNGAVRLRTRLSPRALLTRLLEIERASGRVRDGTKDAPRTLDLDLLLHGAARSDAPDLLVPHPRLHERGFVLEPLAEIAPDVVHPVRGETIAALAARVRDPAAVRLYAPCGSRPTPSEASAG
ncbi:MAG TPA: 2-amino-4-hydroxy-6-hydroxymethyldihydropteridine diphosphokinase [Myxococcota bacterium]|nr:2-amino-4-hydroxy-6-hydroxymethyldihydropteridine diphosphokinase [Myxococcota bacterium]